MASDITDVSARDTPAALIDGTVDPAIRVQFARGRIREKFSQLVLALMRPLVSS